MVDWYYVICVVIGMVECDDVVFIIGCGVKDYFVVGCEKYWFDDVVEVRDAF